MHTVLQLNRGISHLAPYFLDFVVCEGLPYSLLLELSSCRAYTTTTTTTDQTVVAGSARPSAILAKTALLVMVLTTQFSC